ncbi:protein of unknown function [Georgfuchsia toluolica]|uniref:Uncharacterized protein n=2 Tax=Georgfuchsia toluolica TaxID=424218 RepID=A0A916J4C3_9PROT|nr:protein of unknown function [Georgfuchsia toluolica]
MYIEPMPKPELPFASNAKSSQPLIERITAYRPQFTDEHIPITVDKWVLASNLQKSIRRGLEATAEATAMRLLAVDARYFWRRLLVIGYEDIGLADVNLCHDLLKTFRREALHRQLGPERVAAYFASELARACKSRSLCDAIAALEFSVHRGGHERQCFGLTNEQLLTTACDANAPVIERVAALRHVSGYGSFSKGMYRTDVPANKELMREIACRVELSEVETTLFLSGNGISEGMNIPLPLVSQLHRQGHQSIQKTAQKFEGKNGIVYAALDKHTRAGKRCLARLAKEVVPVREFFACRPAADPLAVLGAGLFIVEGGALDRQLVFDGTDELRQMFNKNFLEFAGLDLDDHDELLVLVRDNLQRLNRIRPEEMG